jgi:hypothetical protein
MFEPGIWAAVVKNAKSLFPLDRNNTFCEEG